ncbi:hypothetical protein chiPu_0013691 [Chiloscyllium punctatum]|uniref:Uncharacterized protein n=1 Tax=Chiloscyllium punctatum TaxID=137246 RepID=A0A401SXT3_CHIPU|nr:hypothetical protein [Chiloscyllium punctatum]
MLDDVTTGSDVGDVIPRPSAVDWCDWRSRGSCGFDGWDSNCKKEGLPAAGSGMQLIQSQTWGSPIRMMQPLCQRISI